MNVQILHRVIIVHIYRHIKLHSAYGVDYVAELRCIHKHILIHLDSGHLVHLGENCFLFIVSPSGVYFAIAPTVIRHISVTRYLKHINAVIYHIQVRQNHDISSCSALVNAEQHDIYI